MDEAGHPLTGKEPTPKLRGGLEVIDSGIGEYRLTDNEAHFRATFRRDGYRRIETLDVRNSAIIHSLETFPDHRAIERMPLPEQAAVRLSLVGQKAEMLTLTDARGRNTVVVEAERDGIRTIASIGFEDGTTIGREKGTRWIQSNAATQQRYSLYGEFRRLGEDTIRFDDRWSRQIITRRGDGSRTQVLLREESQLQPDLTIAVVEGPEYIIDEDPQGRVAITEVDRRKKYRTDALLESDRLTHDPKSGNLSFINEWDEKVTISPGGSRTIANDRGTGHRVLTDVGGRMIRQFTRGDKPFDGNEKPSTGYNYDADESGRAFLTEFLTREGQHYMLSKTAKGRQQWDLLNPIPGTTPFFLADRIDMIRGNCFYVEDGRLVKVQTTGGSTITTERTDLPGGGTRVESKAGETDRKPVTTLITDRDSAGRITRQELWTASGHHVRNPEGRDIATTLWVEVDENGQPKPGSRIAGEIVMDVDGTLFRRNYLTEPDPGRPGEIRIVTRRDENGHEVPVVESTMKILLTAETLRTFPDGGQLRRDVDSNVLWRMNPRQEDLVSLVYENATHKKVVGIVEGARRWRWDEKSKAFSLGETPRDATLLSFFDMSVDRGSGDVTLENVDKSKSVIRLDGSRVIEWPNGVKIETGPQGELVQYVDKWGTDFKLYYRDGRVVRIDGKYVGSVAEADYVPPAELPFSERGTRLGTELSLRGWGDEKYVSYIDEKGHRVDVWSDRLTVEYADSSGRTIIRARNPDGFTALTQETLGDATKPIPGSLEVAKDIRVVRNGEDDRYIEYIDAEGRTHGRFPNEVRWICDARGRVIETRDREGKVLTVSYASETTTEPLHIKGERIEWTRDEATGRVIQSETGADGKVGRRTEFANLRIDSKRNLVIERLPGDLRGMVFRNTRTGGRTEIYRNGEIYEYDGMVRLTEIRNAFDEWPFFASLSYERDERVPKTIIDHQGTWDRMDANSERPSDSHVWKERKTEQTRNAAVFAADGRFAFSTPLPMTDPSRLEPKGALKTKVDAAAVLTGIENVTKGHDGTAVVTRVTWQSGRAWVDEEGNRYDSLRVNQDRDCACLLADSGKHMRAIDRDGYETEVINDDLYEFNSLIVRNALREPILVQPVNQRPTRFYRKPGGAEVIYMRQDNESVVVNGNEVGRIAARIQGDDEMGYSTLKVDQQGNQILTGDNGIVRTVSADGTVELVRSDSSRSIFARDMTQARHAFAPGNEVSQVVAWRNGQVEVIFDDGTTCRQESYADVIRSFAADGNPLEGANGAPFTTRGYLEVSDDGNLTLSDSTSGETTVFHRDGRTTRFEPIAGVGWIDRGSGFVCLNREELHERLRSIGAVPPGRVDSAHDVLEQLRTTPLVNRIECHVTRGIRSVPNAQGGRRWTFGEGKAPGERIREVVQYGDGRVDVQFVSGESLKARPGVPDEWARIRESLARLEDQGYEAPAVAKLIAELDRSEVVDSALLEEAGRQWAADPKDPARQIRGVVLVRRAAYDGNRVAARLLAELHLKGQGVEKDGAARGLWNLRAAEAGDAEAQFQVGSGFDFADKQTAANWYGRAAEQGHEMAKVELQKLAKLRIVPNATQSASASTKTEAIPDDPTDTVLPKISADVLDMAKRGLPRGLFLVAEKYAAEKQWARAKIWNDKAVEKGHPRAIELKKKIDAELANSTKAEVIPDDPTDTVLPKIPASVLEAAKKGNPRSQFFVAEKYAAEGQWARAKIWNDKAAEKGFPVAVELKKKIDAELAREKK